MTENSDDQTTPIEIVEELTEDEQTDRHRLELKVERSFYDAGCSLRELRDRRLYRNTHKTWEEYCQDRFGFNRTSAHHKIRAAEVFENLFTFSKQNELGNLNGGLHTNSRRVLPTKETQVRPLLKVEPDEQPQFWDEAVEEAGGKVPSERIVKDVVLRHKKDIVQRLKEKNPSPPEFAEGDVVEIRATKHSSVRPFDGMWAVIEHVGSYSCTVQISIAREVQHCQEGEMRKIEDEYAEDIKAVGERIATLVEFDLEPVDYAILELLQRSKCFTPRQLLYLERIDADYGLRSDDN